MYRKTDQQDNERLGNKLFNTFCMILLCENNVLQHPRRFKTWRRNTVELSTLNEGQTDTFSDHLVCVVGGEHDSRREEFVRLGSIGREGAI